jgi:hypothetical protein
MDVPLEPIAEVPKPCCVRSQHGNLLRCCEIAVASQKSLQAFMLI